MRRTNSGVTLIALIITIIVLLILAGVTIAMVVGDNGVLNQAVNSRIQTDHASVKEAMDLAYSDFKLEQENEYLEEGNSARVASLDIINIDRYAEDEINTLSSFPIYLIYEKECMDQNGVLNVEKLVGSELSTGKGNIEDGTDIYVLEEIDNKYVLKYYDDNSNSEEIWRVSEDSTNTVEVKYYESGEADFDIKFEEELSGEIAFEIEYEDGMTWNEWAETEYNNVGIITDNVSVDDSDIVTTDFNYRLCKKIDNKIYCVKSDEKIDDSIEYVLVLPVPV